MSSEGKTTRGRSVKSVTISKKASEDEKQMTLTSKDKTSTYQEETTDQSLSQILNKLIKKVDWMTEEMKELKDELKEVRKDYTEVIGIIKDITEIKEDMKQKDLIWTEEKEYFERRLKSLEGVEEGRRRKEKKNNIIIKGLDIEGKAEEVENFIKTKLRVEVKVEYTQVINIGNGNKMIRVKLTDWDSKRKIKENKKMLKGEKIYVDDDLTKVQREIQREIGKYASGQRELGKRVKIGYQKIYVDNELMVWKEDKGLVKDYLFRGEEKQE